MRSPVSRQGKAPFLQLISAMQGIAKGNPSRMEFLQRGHQSIGNWSHCDLIQFKADDDIGFFFSTGLKRDGDGFRLFPMDFDYLQENAPKSNDQRKKTAHSHPGNPLAIESPKEKLIEEETNVLLDDESYYEVGILACEVLPCMIRKARRLSPAGLQPKARLLVDRLVSLRRSPEPPIFRKALDNCLKDIACIHGEVC